jgi:hypothetical protein
MQEKNTQNVVLILNRLKSALNFSKDIELATFLGVSTQGISSWRSRNTIDYDLIFAKCGQIDLNWLIKGVGIDPLQDAKIADRAGEVNSGNSICASCAEKDRTIAALEKAVSALEKVNGKLESQIQSGSGGADPQKTHYQQTATG